jgi:hypothetical protein
MRTIEVRSYKLANGPADPLAGVGPWHQERKGVEHLGFLDRGRFDPSGLQPPDKPPDCVAEDFVAAEGHEHGGKAVQV